MWNSDGRNLNRREDSLERSHRLFRLTRSLHFRVRRTARRADVQLTPRIPIGSSKDELFLYESDEGLSAASIVGTPHRGDSSFSADLTADETPATGSRRRFAHLFPYRTQKLRSTSSIIVTPHRGDHSFSDEKAFDEIPATGGHRMLSLQCRWYLTGNGPGE